MTYKADPAALKRWQNNISNAVAKDPAGWNAHDADIQLVVATYNQNLRGVANYPALDWQIVKAILWVESGAGVSAWNTAPMQIGVNGDPGLHELLSTIQGKLILPPDYARTLTMANVPSNPRLNIEAGVGYLLKIHAVFGYVPTPPPSPLTLPYSIPSNALSSLPTTLQATHAIAHRHHVPKVKAPPPHLAITGWRTMTLDFIAKHYNSGDGNYSAKLQFALDIIQGKVKPQPAAVAHPAATPLPTPIRLP